MGVFTRAVCVCMVISCGDNRLSKPRDAPVDQVPAADAALYAACPTPPQYGMNISFREVARVHETGAVLATAPPHDPRLFVVEQRGTVRLLKDEALLPTPFIDLRSAAGGPVIGGDGSLGDEKGLLGLAFHPRYATNGHFFLFYTGSRGGNFHDFVVRCQRSDIDPDRAEPASCVELLAIRDPYTNHQGGMLEFGADGFLYIGLGDGGGGGDPFGNAQNPNSLLGKMLRIDVDRPADGKAYGIPADNPYAGGGGAPEIFMTGLRNPWRWSFDRGTGDMWIGDVGQQIAEELNVLRPSQQRGANLGWSIFEGPYCCETQPYRCVQPAPDSACDRTGFTFPKDNRIPNGESTYRAIIGGVVYRGNCFPDLYGWYFYTDWGYRRLSKARLRSDDTLEVVDSTLELPGNPSSIYTDSRGELYVTNTTGYVYRVEAGP